MNETSFSNDRHTQLPKIAATTLLALVALLAVGCSKGTRVTTKAAGHEIHAIIAGSHSIDSAADRALIASQFGNITIERARLKLDNNPWTKIPEESEVEVRISKGKLWASAGRVTTSMAVR